MDSCEMRPRWTWIRRSIAATSAITALVCAACLFPTWHVVQSQDLKDLVAGLFNPEDPVSPEELERLLQPKHERQCTGFLHFDRGWMPVVLFAIAVATSGMNLLGLPRRRAIVPAIAMLFVSLT